MQFFLIQFQLENHEGRRKMTALEKAEWRLVRSYIPDSEDEGWLPIEATELSLAATHGDASVPISSHHFPSVSISETRHASMSVDPSHHLTMSTSQHTVSLGLSGASGSLHAFTPMSTLLPQIGLPVSTFVASSVPYSLPILSQSMPSMSLTSTMTTGSLPLSTMTTGSLPFPTSANVDESSTSVDFCGMQIPISSSGMIVGGMQLPISSSGMSVDESNSNIFGSEEEVEMQATTSKPTGLDRLLPPEDVLLRGIKYVKELLPPQLKKRIYLKFPSDSLTTRDKMAVVVCKELPYLAIKPYLCKSLKQSFYIVHAHSKDLVKNAFERQYESMKCGNEVSCNVKYCKINLDEGPAILFPLMLQVIYSFYQGHDITTIFHKIPLWTSSALHDFLKFS